MSNPLYSTQGEYGLKFLYESPNPTVEYISQSYSASETFTYSHSIVFVHGLTGNRETTWIWMNKKTSVFWPQDLLKEDVPNARIMTFGYDANIVHALSVAGSNTLRDHAKVFAHDLAIRRKRTNSEHRPLIFVAHSLGGLVIEQALLVCRGGAQSYYKSVLSSTHGIIFIGTPHAGSGKADLLKPLTKLAKVLRPSNDAIVGILKPGSEMLANLQQEFHGMLEDHRRNYGKVIEIFCFYEELEVEGVGKIVPNQSAILSQYESRSIHGNHMQIARFSGKTDQGYVAVSDQLWTWVNSIESQPTRTAMFSEYRAAGTGSPQQITQSGGGPIFMGTSTAGRDFNINIGQAKPFDR